MGSAKKTQKNFRFDYETKRHLAKLSRHFGVKESEMVRQLINAANKKVFAKANHED